MSLSMTRSSQSCQPLTVWQARCSCRSAERSPVMFALVSIWFFVASAAIVAVLAFTFLSWLGSRFIPEHLSGLVIKRFGRALPPGRLIAVDGEAGYQSRLLPPGWHWGLWRWRYKVLRVPLVQVPAGEIALVKAVDGAAVPPGRILAKDVPCDRFQDAERSEEHTSELQSPCNLVCRLLLEKHNN